MEREGGASVRCVAAVVLYAGPYAALPQEGRIVGRLFHYYEFAAPKFPPGLEHQFGLR